MLRLITGKAGTGKTAAIIEEIRQAVEKRQGSRLLIVPEQYSHEAERELARVAGPRLPLYAEVLSFTGLARKLEAELGSGAAHTASAPRKEPDQKPKEKKGFFGKLFGK